MKRNSWTLSATSGSEPLVPLGKIVATHGLEGWLRCNSFNPQTATLASLQQIVLEKDGQNWSCEVEASKAHRKRWLVKLRGADRLEEAEKWIGFTLCVKESDLESPGPGQYYHYQAIGLEVYDLRGKRIGTVTRIMCVPGGVLYVVQGATKEHLIPAVKEMIEKVDFTAGKMIIDPPDGLLDL